jgi:hypothetical protein
LRFTGERFEMGYPIEPVPEGSMVRLDDGREVVPRVGQAGKLYRLTGGERVCVSFAPGREPELTGFLT